MGERVYKRRRVTHSCRRGEVEGAAVVEGCSAAWRWHHTRCWGQPGGGGGVVVERHSGGEGCFLNG